MPITEIAVVPLTPETKVGDPDTDGAKIFKQSADTIVSQDGMQKMRFGMHHEAPQTMSMFIDWDTIEKHKEFIASDTYGPFMQTIGPIVGEEDKIGPILGEGKLVIFHVDFKNEEGVVQAFSAPVTEVATFYFDGAPSDDYLDGALKFGQIATQQKAAGYHGMAIGVTVEELQREGVKGHAAVLIIGWDSVQSHMDFRATDLFKENIHLLRSNSKSIEMHHVTVMDVAS